MHTLNILSLNVNGLNSAVKRTRVLEYLHRKSISCALIQETYLICGTGLRHLLVGYLFVTLHSQCFFFNIHDYIKEWLVLFFLFPSLSLFLLTGLLKYWVCVCCFVLFVLSGCYVVMLCVKRNKKIWSQKKSHEETLTWQKCECVWESVCRHLEVLFEGKTICSKREHRLDSF